MVCRFVLRTAFLFVGAATIGAATVACAPPCADVPPPPALHACAISPRLGPAGPGEDARDFDVTGAVVATGRGDVPGGCFAQDLYVRGEEGDTDLAADQARDAAAGSWIQVERAGGEVITAAVNAPSFSFDDRLVAGDDVHLSWHVNDDVDGVIGHLLIDRLGDGAVAAPALVVDVSAAVDPAGLALPSDFVGEPFTRGPAVCSDHVSCGDVARFALELPAGEFSTIVPYGGTVDLGNGRITHGGYHATTSSSCPDFADDGVRVMIAPAR